MSFAGFIDAHCEGFNAALGGKEFWQNPYAQCHERPEEFTAWLAGWCEGKQYTEDIK